MDTLERLSALITLAKIDGEIVEKERNQILSIGQANHLLVAEILPLFTSQKNTEKDFLHTHDKEQVLLELVQLMQIDSKIYHAEIRYCARMVARLGFREPAVFEVMLRAKELAGDPETLKKALKQYQVA